MVRFPDGFLFGCATSAYQVEGSVDADGRTPSIWDVFCAEPGRIDPSSVGWTDGSVACDNYRLWEQDLDLMAGLGMQVYRFSVGWPRIMPSPGVVNPAGLDHYERLVDGLLARDITPMLTLYHWDLPVWAGGWERRDCVDAFAELTEAVAGRVGDRVPWWVTINEPWIVGVLGHQLGLHAPGHTDVAESVRVMHHLLLAHGRAVEVLRSLAPKAKAGLSHSYFPHYPASESPEDAAASWASDGFVNRWFLDPITGRGYPSDMAGRYAAYGGLDAVRDGDLDLIATPTDFVGINYYTRRVVRAGHGDRFDWEVCPADPSLPQTDVGWEVVPRGLTDTLLRIQGDYGLPTFVTENGGLYADGPGPDGVVRDERRVDLIRDHLQALLDALAAGADVRGYCHWSLLDNFEWALGYDRRFGLVHVDYPTQRRAPKTSAHYYTTCITTRRPV